MANKPVAIFDTSVFNKLTEDNGSSSRIAGLKSGFTILLTGTNLDEIVATSSSEQRRVLLDVCRRLLSAGYCIQPHHWIVEQLIAEFQKAASFDWKRVGVRFPECENEIARQEIIDDQLAAEQRNDARIRQDEFAKVFDDARPHFEPLFTGGTETRPADFRDLVSRLRVPGGAFWNFGIGLYERAAKSRPDEQTIRKFIGECPPFHALLLALCVAQYERCIRDLKTGLSYRAGRFDLYMSVYLPYCDQFITADERQQRCLAEVASNSSLSVKVR